MSSTKKPGYRILLADPNRAFQSSSLSPTSRASALALVLYGEKREKRSYSNFCFSYKHHFSNSSPSRDSETEWMKKVEQQKDSSSTADAVPLLPQEKAHRGFAPREDRVQGQSDTIQKGNVSKHIPFSVY